MSCPGLHCPGCSEGQSIGIAGGVVLGLVLLDQTVQWVAARIWWIGGTVAVCFALAVAAGMWLERQADRRGARFAEAHGILSRADVILPEPVIRQRIDDVPAARPALLVPQVVFNFYGTPGAGQARIIRQALTGPGGNIPEGHEEEQAG